MSIADARIFIGLVFALAGMCGILGGIAFASLGSVDRYKRERDTWIWLYECATKTEVPRLPKSMLRNPALMLWAWLVNEP